MDYDSGFTTATQVGGADVYQNVPDWLKEVTYLTAKTVYDVGGSCDGKELLDGPKGDMITNLIVKKARNVPFAVKPVFPRR